LIQKLLHQFKGFAPVFCHDSLIAKIKLTESLCKEIKDSEGISYLDLLGISKIKEHKNNWMTYNSSKNRD
jgi:hypothetical protein